MSIFAITVSLGSRMCFSMILTQMVFIPNINQTKNPNHEIICPVEMNQETSQDNQTSTVSKKAIAPIIAHTKKRHFCSFFFKILNIDGLRKEWSQELQGIILSSFNWGYSVAMFSSGIIVQRFGAKLVLLVGLFLSAIIIILTPLAVTLGMGY